MGYQKELEVAKKLARDAGATMLEYFNADQQLEHKDIVGATEVTIADKKINSMVIRELTRHFDDGIVGEEESTAEYGMGRRWVCDPIDGTKAFVIGVPTSMFSLALVVDGTPVLGVLYDPFLNRLFWGITGRGSFCNDERLKVASGGMKDNYIVMHSNPAKIIHEGKLVTNLLKTGARLDTVYGAVYKSALVAQGRAVGYMEKYVNPHDIAAAHVIVEEAGGLVTGYEGAKLDYSKPFKGAIISNKTVHQQLLDCIIKSAT